MSKIPIQRIKDQSQGPEGKKFAEALRNRANGAKATVAAMSDAAGVSEMQVLQWLGGWEVPAPHDILALYPVLNLEIIAPDKPAIKRTNGEVITPAQYSSKQLETKANLPKQLESMREAAMNEWVSLKDLKPYDKYFLMPRVEGEKESRKGKAGTEKKSQEGHYVLREAIMAPLAEGDSFFRFIDLLADYYDVTLKELDHTIGLSPGVVNHWKRSSHLPERENFLIFREWAEKTFDHATVSKITHLYIKDALEKYTSMAQLRNLPPEFWVWKLEITNQPACAASPDQPSWGEFVRPIKTKQEYLTCVRRAEIMYRDEFTRNTSASISQLMSFERGQITPKVEEAIIAACEELNVQRAERGEEPLFDLVKFKSLPSIAPKVTEPLGEPSVIEGHAKKLAAKRAEQMKKPPEFSDGQDMQFAALSKRLDTPEKRQSIGFPEKLAEFADLSSRDVDKILGKAKQYMFIKGNVFSFERDFKALHADVSANQGRRV